MEKVLTKLTELSDCMKTIQEKNTSLEKKHDGLVGSEIKTLTEKATLLSEEIEKIQAGQKSHDEQKARIENLEKVVSLGGGQKDADFKEYDTGLSKYLRKGSAMNADAEAKMMEHYLAGEKTGLSDTDVKSLVKNLQVQSNPDGGYFVMPERLSATVGRDFETSPMRELCNVMSTSNESVELVIDDDEPDAEWASETASRPGTGTPKIGLLKIHAHELYAKPKATQKMLDDAGFDVGSWLAGKISSKFARKENTAFVLGDGQLKAKGFLDYAEWSTPGSYQRNALERVDTGVNGVISADNLLSLQGALIEGYQKNANFLMKRQTFFSKILTLKAGSGEYLFDPQLLKNGAGNFILLGQPVHFGSDMPGSGVTGAQSIAYGDFRKGYTIVDRMGITVLRDPYSSKPYVEFYSTKRVGGAVTNYEAIKILKEEV